MSNIILKSGRKIYANRYLVSICPPELAYTKEWELCQGYDGDIWLTNCDYENPKYPFGLYQTEFTPNELNELADHIIELWSRFKKEIPELHQRLVNSTNILNEP